jgi:hypothetical protein
VKTEKKVKELRGDIRLVSNPFFRKIQIHPTKKKNEPSGQEMHLKIPLSSRGLKSSNSKTGRKVAALHIFVK